MFVDSHNINNEMNKFFGKSSVSLINVNNVDGTNDDDDDG